MEQNKSCPNFRDASPSGLVEQLVFSSPLSGCFVVFCFSPLCCLSPSDVLPMPPKGRWPLSFSFTSVNPTLMRCQRHDDHDHHHDS